ncbi:interleukin-1 beta [Diretmus argenteus]
MPHGLGLQISHHPLSMRRVVNLIIAMDRFKDNRMVQSSAFRDEDLLNIMLENIVEEQFVLEVSSAPQGDACSCFERTGEHTCSVNDSEKRNLVLVQNAMKLHAVMLQGGSDQHIVRLNMSTYVHPLPSAEARPVVLGITGTNFYMSCSKEGSKPTLHLEKVENKDDLKCIIKGSEMARFLFYKQDTGLDASTLTSASFPTWYISTADDNNLPVDMCQETADRHRNFTIQRQN